jgi:hypothetical protein
MLLRSLGERRKGTWVSDHADRFALRMMGSESVQDLSGGRGIGPIEHAVFGALRMRPIELPDLAFTEASGEEVFGGPIQMDAHAVVEQGLTVWPKKA